TGVAAWRRRRYAAIAASAALPHAMPAAAMKGICVVAFASRAPTKMAGQYVGPRMTRAAIASPVGGQTGEMDGPMVAYRSPKTATTKYAAVRAPARASHHNPDRTVTGCGKQIAASWIGYCSRARGDP